MNENVANSMQSGEPMGAGVPSETIAEQVTVSEAGPVFTEKKSNKGMLLGLILCLVLAVGGIGFGIWAMMDKNTQVNNLNGQIASLNSQVATLQEQVGDDADTADYIYVGEWGLKIKIGDRLKMVSYYFDERNSEDDAEYLYINGLDSVIQGLPSFINTPTQQYWLGCVHRQLAGSQYRGGQLVFSDDAYDYYYGHPQVVSSNNESDIQLKLQTVETMKQLLMDPDNYSSI